MNYTLTSEAMTRGHPDKLCDQIADAVLDDVLAHDPAGRVACEACIWQNHVHLLGELSSSHTPDFDAIARRVIADAGYLSPSAGFDAQSCRVRADFHTQSPDIARGVSRKSFEDTGAGGQGMMFGYACRETEVLMPLPIVLANRLAKALEQARRDVQLPYLLPDGKAQVSVEYCGGKVRRIATVVLSAQHSDTVDTDTLREDILRTVLLPALPPELVDGDTVFFINPTGRFVDGGPAFGAGLSGRKAISDAYGASARHGGGSFSGKDPTKVDRTGAYMARYLAKNIVAAGLAERCEVQLAYAIGLADPVSVMVQTFGTGLCSDEALSRWIARNVDMRPGVVIGRFDLLRPIYSRLSCYGQFGENARDLPWEQTDLHISPEDL